MAKGERFKIDQAGTFDSAVLMGVDRKCAFRSETQETTADGVPKWVAEIGTVRTVFGRSERAILRVNIASYTNPGEGLPLFGAVTLVGLEANVGPKTDRDNRVVPGVQIWYRADALHTANTPSARGTKSQPDGS